MAFEVMDYMAKHHPDMSIRRDFKDVIRTGIDATAVKDEYWDSTNPFFNLNNIRTDVERIANNPNKSAAERQNASEFLRELTIENKPSLESSSIDGGIFINQKLARIIWALEGKEIGDFNGM